MVHIEFFFLRCFGFIRQFVRALGSRNLRVVDWKGRKQKQKKTYRRFWQSVRGSCGPDKKCLAGVAGAAVLVVVAIPYDYCYCPKLVLVVVVVLVLLLLRPFVVHHHWYPLLVSSLVVGPLRTLRNTKRSTPPTVISIPVPWGQRGYGSQSNTTKKK